MRLGRLNHIGVAVPDMGAAITFWREVMGASKFSEEILIEDHGMRVVFVETPVSAGLNGTQIELIAEITPGTAISKFLEKNPSGGQHHVCFEVPEIVAARAWFENAGKRVLGPTRPGAHGTPIFFVHPGDMGGVLTEIMETPKDAH